MALADGSAEAVRIDTALAEWRQSDVAFDECWFVHVADVMQPLSEAATAASGSGVSALHSETAGLVVLTQTCDLVRHCTARPYLEVAPLVEVTDDDVWRDAQKGRRPALATFPALVSRRLAVDLDRVMTLEKSIVAAWKRTEGLLDDEDARAFAAALARKRARFAFPDEFTAFARKLVSRMSSKHDKDTSEGRGLRALREIRVQATPHLDADPTSLLFLFVRDPGQHDFEGENWADLLKKWLALVPAGGTFTNVDGIVTTLDDMTGADYVGSSRLDLDHLSQGHAEGGNAA